MVKQTANNSPKETLAEDIAEIKKKLDKALDILTQMKNTQSIMNQYNSGRKA